MKGIILAGGTGSRLRPLTRVLNKHLFPVGNLPMIFWPIKKLKEAEILDILIVTNEKDIPLFKELLGNGEKLGVRLSYTVQLGAKGIADGLLCGKKFANGEPIVVLLGDNIFQDPLKPYIEHYQDQKSGAMVLLKKVKNPNSYGVAQVDEKSNKIIGIEEKPQVPKSNNCVTGIYIFDNKVFEIIQAISPSARGELEITDVNNIYMKNEALHYQFLSGFWIDAGTYQDWHRANLLIKEEIGAQKND